MKHFFKKNIGVNLMLMTFLIPITLLHAQENRMKLSFEEIDFSIGRKHRDRLIDTYKEAVKIGLSKENEKADQFYKNNAIYLFNVGGGCFGASPNEISVVLENKEVKITWEEPKEPCPEVGEAMAFYGRIIISKRDYPNYKKFRFKYY